VNYEEAMVYIKQMVYVTCMRGVWMSFLTFGLHLCCHIFRSYNMCIDAAVLLHDFQYFFVNI
jgi:hypothetical protein